MNEDIQSIVIRMNELTTTLTEVSDLLKTSLEANTGLRKAIVALEDENNNLRQDNNFLKQCIDQAVKDTEHFQIGCAELKSKLEKGIRVYANQDADEFFLLDHPYSTNATLVLDEVE